MKTHLFKRGIAGLLSLVICLSAFIGLGTTTAFAAGEQAEVYLISFPRNGDTNLDYSGKWGHPEFQFMNGWFLGASNFTIIRALNSYDGNICYCIEPGTPQDTGDRYTSKDESFWDNLPSDFNSTISPCDMKLFIGRIMQYGYTDPVSTVKASQKAAQAAKATAKAAVAGVKAAVKATIAAVKAIIAATKALVAAIAAGGWVAVMMILVVVLLGCALALFGGNSGGDYQAVSAEVEAYTPYIRQYAEEYGIGEYVELIKAVMMQESGGKGTDPMQCSECGYNTTGGYIQDPVLSINWGIHTLADSMNLAGVESPVDMEHIRLALQGYNYGPGYIYWAIRRYGGYDVTNALEFSENMKAQLGTSVYGDPQYVYHVLRYYPYGRALNRIGDQTIVEVAASQLGNVGGEPYWSWYGFESRVSWCACFVSWCADQCGYIDAGIIPKFSGCVTGVNWFQGQNRWLDGSAEPNPGMIIFFDWDNKGGSGPQDGLADHVGIVQRVENGIVYTIEGNSGDSCRQNQYPVGHYEILGYGVIAY